VWTVLQHQPLDAVVVSCAVLHRPGVVARNPLAHPSPQGGPAHAPPPLPRHLCAAGCFVCALTRLLAPPASLTLLPRQGAALVVDAAGRPFYLPHPQLVPGALTTPFLGTLPAQQLKLQVQAQVQEAVALPGGQYLLLVCAAAPPQPLQLHLPGWADLQKPGASSAVCGSPASSSRAATAGQQEEAVVEEAGGAAAGSVPGIGGTAGGAAGAAGRILLLDLGLLQLVGELMPPPGSAWAGTQAGVSSSSSSSSSSSGSEGVTAGAAPLLATTQRGYLVAGESGRRCGSAVINGKFLAAACRHRLSTCCLS
jgi:hypothetical protein